MLLIRELFLDTAISVDAMDLKHVRIMVDYGGNSQRIILIVYLIGLITKQLCLATAIPVDAIHL